MTNNKTKTTINRVEILAIDTSFLTLIGLKSITSQQRNISIDTVNSKEIDTYINNFKPKYDLYILDIRLEGETKNCLKGIKLIEKIRKNQKNAKVIVYTLCEGVWHLKQYIRLNLSGLIHKTAQISEIKKGIECVLANKRFICPYFRRLLKADNTINSDSFLLNSNINTIEYEIIRLAAQGYSSREIALKLDRSIHTIIDYRKLLFSKFNVNTMEGLIVKAIRNGFPITK